MFLFRLKMKEECHVETDALHEKDKFKKITLSPDSTDIMSDFLDK